MKFYLDFHWITLPWRWTLANGSDVKYVLSAVHYGAPFQAWSCSMHAVHRQYRWRKLCLCRLAQKCYHHEHRPGIAEGHNAKNESSKHKYSHETEEAMAFCPDWLSSHVSASNLPSASQFKLRQWSIKSSNWPSSKMPLDKHSITRRNASPGPSGWLLLLSTFSTSNSMALWEEKKEKKKKRMI